MVCQHKMKCIVLPSSSNLGAIFLCTGILGQIMQQRPNHGMDWSADTKQAFQRSIMKTRKDFSLISKEVKQSKGDCQNYYYSTFKNSSVYDNLKQALEQDLVKELNQELLSACARCHKEGGKMVSCSICQKNFHLECCQHPPKDASTNWFCNDCDPQED